MPVGFRPLTNHPPQCSRARFLGGNATDGPRSCIFCRTGVCLRRTAVEAIEKVKAYFRLATDARPPRVAQKREPTWRSAGRTAVRSEDSPGQRLSGASHAERSMSDARGHEHRPANGRRAGAVPHGEAKAWLVRQGRGGRKEANPRTTSVWNPLLLFDLASTTSSTLGKSGPSALSRLRPRRPQGLFFDFGLEGPHAKRDR